ncbi:AAA family ATPase [Pseudomonas sp. GTC 16482]|uniref:AAA family ATPase n=1 Tax=Pseudomonas sp. GTC 16482 TaxID=1661693 RepID=UPI000761D315|nr:AAA family ATPase [Pseudomonas sp. GTC 16482]
MKDRRTGKQNASKAEANNQKQSISVKSLRISTPAFRKLKNITIEFAERITLIAGHNGIGKSTILGLVANGSGLTTTTARSLGIPLTYTGKQFNGVLNEIVHIDYESEYLVHKNNDTLASPFLDYTINGDDISVRCGFTHRTVKNSDKTTERIEPRVVARIPKGYTDPTGKVTIGVSSKVPLPTIYLGMTRMIPIGESNPELVENTLDDLIHPDDAKFIDTFIQDVISISGASSNPSSVITTQSIRGTNKVAKHPKYTHSPKSISLGQDSLSAIATALASFFRLQREWPDYPGGLLVIDELDAGFHPHAQKSLIDGLKNAAKKLRLQVIGTTHSLCMIEAIHPDANPLGEKAERVDGVVYITDSIAPRAAQEMSLQNIKDDMMLTPPKPAEKPKKVNSTLKIYLEDAEANFFLTKLLTQKLKRQVNAATGKTLKAIPISVGCNNLQGLQKFDSHFKTVLIVVDADSNVDTKLKNVVKLPGGSDASGHGFSPERTIYEFAQELMQDKENFPIARAALKKINVTRNQIGQHLLKDTVNIKERVSAKSWMNRKLQQIQDWGIVDLWLAEHPDLVERFQNDLLAAATHTAKLTK